MPSRFLLTALCVLVTSRPAGAQFYNFPDPPGAIDADDLRQVGDYLTLSDAQAAVLDSAYRDYSDRYRNFLEQRIQPFLAEYHADLFGLTVFAAVGGCAGSGERTGQTLPGVAHTGQQPG